MDSRSYTVRVPKRWARIVMIVGVTALIVAPLTAVATHSFTDVPDTHTFHEDIAWMKDSGVTKGCNPPTNSLYCPDDDVTRGQMAAFMRRFAQYLGAEDGTPAQADNADMVDGLDAEDFVEEQEINSVTEAMTTNEPGVAQLTAPGGAAIPANAGTLFTVTIDAPTDGYAIVSMDTDVQINHTNGATSLSEVGVSATANSLGNDEDKDFQIPGSAATGQYITGQSMVKVFPVSSGSNTFYVVGDQSGGTGTLFDTHLSATFVASAYGTVDIASSQGGEEEGQG